MPRRRRISRTSPSGSSARELFVRELRELVAAGFEARAVLGRQRAPSLLHHTTIVHHQRARREHVPHRVGEEHFANSGDIGAAVELAGDIEQRVELIDLQRQTLVEALKLFVNAAVVDRGCRGTQSDSANKRSSGSVRSRLDRPGASTPTRRSAFTSGTRSAAPDAVKTSRAQTLTSSSPTPAIAGGLAGPGISSVFHRSSLRPRRAAVGIGVGVDVISGPSLSRNNTPAQLARVSPMATNRTRSRISESSSERFSVELKSRSARTSESFFCALGSSMRRASGPRAC